MSVHAPLYSYITPCLLSIVGNGINCVTGTERLKIRKAALYKYDTTTVWEIRGGGGIERFLTEIKF